MNMDNPRQRRGRRRLFILSGFLALTVMTAAVAVAWADEAVVANDGSLSTVAPAGTDPAQSADETRGTPSSGKAEADSDNQAAIPTTTTAAEMDRPPAPTEAPVQAEASKSAPAKEKTVKVKIYFTQGEKLTPIFREIAGTDMVGTAALSQLLKGPDDPENASGLLSAIPQGTALRSLSVKNGLAVVDLSADFVSGGGSSSMYLRLGQLVYTLTEFQTVDRVKIRIDGSDLRVLGGEGLLVGDSISRTQYDGLVRGSTEDGPGTSAPKTSSFKVYFVTQERLAPQTRTVPFTPAIGKTALMNLLAGPSSAERDGGANTAVPSKVRVNSLSIKDRVATVDLGGQFVTGGGSQSMYLRLGQVVYTLTQFPTVDRVQLKVDGKLLTSLGGEGLLLKQPASRADWEKLIQ